MVCAISAVVTQADVGGEIKKFQGLFQRRRSWGR
jgi:hypothetical protein